MAGELGSAFISIFPKLDKGFKNDIKKGVDEGAKGAGESSGSLIGGNLGKGIIKAIGALGVGKAIGDIIGQSFNNFKDYQQLTGGVETLFKDNADIVERYASNAFQTAGLSANQYMETVTGFSASLLQSLGGDTEKAAQYANKAVTDMSDNANKMGTSMESIQNAYQGFAKQNYTMLDNLKLGYGGTKQEMERLLQDAEKISGVHYDISSYADVVDAIHVMQVEMGIAGTTALEASTTVEGSLNMLSASWQNFLTGLAGAGDMGELTSDLINSIKTVAQNVLPVLGTIVTSLVTALPTLLEEIVIALQENAPAIMQGAMEMFNGLVDGLVNSLPNIITGLIGLVATLASTLISLAPQILGAGITLFFGIVQAIPSAIPAILGGIGNIISSAVGALGGAVGQFVSAGVNIVQGIARGIASAPGAVLDAIMNICRSGLDAVKNFFGIHSPSRVMAEQGKFIALGLAKGIEDNAKYASNAIADMNNSVYGQVADVTASATVKANTSSEFGAVVAILEEINRNIPEGMTGRQFARAVKNTYA